MKISVVTVAPSLVVLGTIVWLLQAYLDPPEAQDVPKPSTLEVAETLLTPALERTPGRNPFRLEGEVDEPGPASPKPRGPAALQASAPSAKGPASAAPRPSWGLGDRFRRLVESLKIRAEKARLVREDLKAKVDGKAKLSATSILGGRRIAILNGRSYAEGEAIDWASGLSGPIRVAEVRPASVVLGSGGARFEVSFPTASTATAPAPAVATARPVSKRSAGTRKAAGASTGRPR